MPAKKISELNLNWEEIDGAAQRGASLEELCAIAALSKSEFKRAVKHWKYLALHRYMERMKLQGDYLIKQAQFDAGVIEKNPSMLKWLGIQRLGQRANVVNDELNKGLGEAPESIPSGYEILSPKAAVLLGPNATIDVTPFPHDEKPAVEAILEQEITAPQDRVKDRETTTVVISGHTGARHEA